MRRSAFIKWSLYADPRILLTAANLNGSRKSGDATKPSPWAPRRAPVDRLASHIAPQTFEPVRGRQQRRCATGATQPATATGFTLLAFRALRRRAYREGPCAQRPLFTDAAQVNTRENFMQVALANLVDWRFVAANLGNA